MSEHHCRPTISLPDSFTIPSTRPWKSSRCKTRRDYFQTHWMDEKLVEDILKKIGLLTDITDGRCESCHQQSLRDWITT